MVDEDDVGAAVPDESDDEVKDASVAGRRYVGDGLIEQVR